MKSNYTELLLGCGHRRKKDIALKEHPTFENVVTVDINPDVSPDVLWDLNTHPLPFDANTFDEIHAYEVLEHLGRLGDYKGYFEEFEDYWRILKPGGILCAHTPAWNSAWAFGDPGHTRIFNEYMLTYLSQQAYIDQQGKTPMTDYRNVYKGDFAPLYLNYKEGSFRFIIKALKPNNEFTRIR